MPQYSYRCSVCEESHDIIKSFAEFEREEHCPKCNTVMVREVNRSSSFQLKGPGWFKSGGY